MERLIENTFGIHSAVISCKPPKGLPFYMANGRDFFNIKINGIDALLVEIPDSEKFGVIAFEKQLKTYVEAAGKPAAFLFHTLNKIQRDALTKRMIPFLCLPEQIFLPFLGVALSNRFVEQKTLPSNKMSPMTQVLFLYFIYKAGDKPVFKKQAALELNISQMSVTRASTQLEAMGLIKQEAQGKELWMKATATGQEYYDLARPFLINPLHKTLVTNRTPELMDLTKAGETALSMHSMLNAPPVPVVAADKKAILIQDLKIVDEKWQPENELIQVELWKYDPALFSYDGTVDPISLAVSLRDVHDERVQGELEDYLEGLRW